MKRLLIGLLITTSFSSFASEKIKITQNTIKSTSVSSVCVPDDDYPSIRYDLMFTLKLNIAGVNYTKEFRSNGAATDCVAAKFLSSKSLSNILKDIDDVEDGNIQVLNVKDSLVCYKSTITLLVEGNQIQEVISSYKVVPCP